jgi:hypothetical protein
VLRTCSFERASSLEFLDFRNIKSWEGRRSPQMA